MATLKHFLILSLQRLPILRTFCLFCAMGVFMLYIFAVTFFAGCVVLDERDRPQMTSRQRGVGVTQFCG